MTDYEMPEFAKQGEVKEVKSQPAPVKVKKSFCERHPRTCKAGKVVGGTAAIVGGTALIVAAAPEALTELAGETMIEGHKRVKNRYGKTKTETAKKPVRTPSESKSRKKPSKTSSRKKTVTKTVPAQSKKKSTTKKKTASKKKPVTRKKSTRKPKSDGLDYWRI